MTHVTAPLPVTELDPAYRSLSGMPARILTLIKLESRGLDALPGRRWGIFAAALLVGLVFGGLRPGIERFYAESAPFLVLALAFGLFGRTTAAVLVLGYVASDAVRAFTDIPVGVQVEHVLVDRIVAWILLWVLAAALSRFARRTAASFEALLRRLPGLGTPGAVRVVRALGGGGLFVAAAFAFMQLMPYLRTRDIAPGYQDVLLLQGSGLLLAAIAGALYVIVEIVIRPRIGGDGDLVELEPTFPVWSLGGLGRRILGFGVVIFVFQGLITRELDVIVFGAAFIAGEAASFAISRSPRLLATLDLLPEQFRLVLGLAITVAAAYVLYATHDEFNLVTEYFEWVVAIAVGYFALRVLFATSSRSPASSATDGSAAPFSVPPAAASLVVVAAVGFFGLAAASPVLADNCVGMIDCVQGAIAGAAAAIAAAAAGLWAAANGAAKGPNPKLKPPGPLGEYKDTTRVAKIATPQVQGFGDRVKALYKRATDALGGKSPDS